MRRGLLLLMCILVLLTGVAAADIQVPTGDLMVLQVGNSQAYRNGEAVQLPSGAYYAANGAVMVPLRYTAEAMGYTISWDSTNTSATVSKGDIWLTVQTGSWHYRSQTGNGTVPSPPVIRGGVLYAPLLTLSKLPGIYVHSFGYYEGAFAAISNYPLTESDEKGQGNAAFDPGNPDPALTACREAVLKVLKPNKGLFEQSAVIFRRNSRFIYRERESQPLFDKGDAVGAFQGSDGYLMISVRGAAEAFGGTYQEQADGSALVTLGEHTACFPAENGYLHKDGVRREHKYYGGCRKDGQLYCSVYSFTNAFGLYGYSDRNSQGILLSPFDLTKQPDLQSWAWRQTRKLRFCGDEDAKGYIALTFDDGPGVYTARLLDGLKARDAKATFFLCNYRIVEFPELMKRYGAEGHEVGNHSATHAILSMSRQEKIEAELDVTNESIRKLTGSQVTLMRPPGGGFNDLVLQEAAERGMSCFMWSVDPVDWQKLNTAAVYNHLVWASGDGDIVLLHDLYSSTVSAALQMVDTLSAQGYRFVTLSELAAIKGITLVPGQVYYEIS